MLVPNDDQLKRAEYCGDVLVMNIGRRLGMFKLVNTTEGAV